LEELMGGTSRRAEDTNLIRRLAEAIDAEDFKIAGNLLEELKTALGENDPEVTRARTLMSFIQETA
jgi:hypothetical protein